MTKRKRGRPALPPNEVKKAITPMRLNQGDRKLFALAAKASNKTLSEWMRDTLREAALRVPAVQKALSK